MEKYSKEWKLKQGAWIQDHKNSSGEKIYKIHYIENDTEYSKGEYFTKKDASDALRASRAAAALGRIKSERKAASSRENGKKGGRPGKQYTIDDIEKLSDRQLRKLIEKTDRMCVIVNYHHPEKTYLPELRCADIPAHTETVLESLHQHVRDEQLRRSNQ